MGSIAVIAGAAAAAHHGGGRGSHHSSSHDHGSSGDSHPTKPAGSVSKSYGAYRYEHDPYVQPPPPSESDMEKHKEYGKDPGIWENGVLVQAYSD